MCYSQGEFKNKLHIEVTDSIEVHIRRLTAVWAKTGRAVCCALLGGCGAVNCKQVLKDHEAHG